jgi:hypothetical protein
MTFECDCGGTVERFARAGRVYTIHWTGLRYEVPDNLALLACRVCGDLWTDGADLEELEQLARVAWIEQVTALVRAERGRAENALADAWEATAALLPALWDAGIRAEFSVSAHSTGGAVVVLRSARRHVPRKVVLWIMGSTVVASMLCQDAHVTADAPVEDTAPLLAKVRAFLQGDEHG